MPAQTPLISLELRNSQFCGLNRQFDYMAKARLPRQDVIIVTRI
jgi:hypothetical protein